MRSPLLCHHVSSSTWTWNSRSMNRRAWRSTWSTRLNMRLNHLHQDLLSPLLRSDQSLQSLSMLSIFIFTKHYKVFFKLIFPIKWWEMTQMPINVPFVCHLQALEAVNVHLRQLYPDSEELFDVVLMTNHHANVGLRLINSINHHSKCRAPSSGGQDVQHLNCPLNWYRNIIRNNF